MKSTLKHKLIIILALLATVACFCLCACGGDKKEQPKNEVANYSFDSKSRSFFVDDEFSVDGLKLKITYSNGEQEEVEVTRQMIKFLPSLSVEGDKAVVFVYNGNEFTYAITVKEPEVVSYEFSGIEDDYWLNSSFDIGEMVLSIKYSNGKESTIPVSLNMILDMPDMKTDGEKNIIVLYDNNSYNTKINVVKPKSEFEQLESYEIIGIKKNYYQGDELSIEGGELLLRFQDGSTKTVGLTSKMLKEMPNMTSAGQKFVKFKYDGFTYSCKINVQELVVENSFFSGLVTTYQAGSEFSLDNAELTIDYNSGKREVVNLTEEMLKESPDMNVDGKKTVTFVVNGKDYNYTFSVLTPENIAMLNKIRAFMQDYNDEDLKGFSVKLEVEGEAEFLQEYTWVKKLALDYDYNGEEITLFVKSLYNALVSAIVSGTMDIELRDLYKDGQYYKAFFDLVKNIDLLINSEKGKETYESFMNKAIFNENYHIYVEQIRKYIVDLLKITDKETAGKLDALLSKDIREICFEQQTPDSLYQMLKDLNEVIQSSNGLDIVKDGLNAIIGVIDGTDKHVISNFVYELRKFANVTETDEKTGEKKIVLESDEFVKDYYSKLRNLVIHLEEIDENTDYKALASRIIADLYYVGESRRSILDYGYELNNFYELIGDNNGVSKFIDNVIVKIGSIQDIIDQAFINNIKDTVAKYVPSDISTAIGKCIDIIYNGITVEKKEDIDYSKIIEDVCDILKQEYDKYITQFENKELKLVEEIFDTYIDLDQYTGNEFEALKTLRSVCVKVDDLINKGYNQDRLEDITKDLAIVYLYQKEKIDDEIIDPIVELAETYLPDDISKMVKDLVDVINESLKVQKEEDINANKLLVDILDIVNGKIEEYQKKLEDKELKLVQEIFDKNFKLSDYSGDELENLKSIRAICVVIDELINNGYDSQYAKDIAKQVEAMLGRYLPETDLKTVFALLNKYLDGSTEIGEYIAEVVKVNKDDIKSSMLDVLKNILSVDGNNQTVCGKLENVIDNILNDLCNGEFKIEKSANELMKFTEENCPDYVRTFTKTVALFTVMILQEKIDIDFNEMFKDITLPEEVESIDFNKFISKITEGEFIEKFVIDGVEVTYVKDVNGKIVKEVLLLKVGVKGDVMIAKLDVEATLKIELNF